MRVSVHELALSELRAHTRTLGGPDSFNRNTLVDYIVNYYRDTDDYDGD
jgi:hypothetical protein